MVVENVITSLSDIFNRPLINLSAAAVTLLLGIIVGRTVGKFLQAFLIEIKANKIVSKVGLKIDFSTTLAHLVEYAIYLTVTIISLNQLGLASITLLIIEIIAIALIIISLILSFKDFFPNVLATWHIYRNNLFAIGDTIEYKNTKGKVIEINLIETKIKTKEDEYTYIPNFSLIKDIVKTKTKAETNEMKKEEKTDSIVNDR